MSKNKSITDLYLDFAVKNNIIKKNQLKKAKDLEFVISKAIAESFKKEMTHTLSEFGYLKKVFSMKEGKRVGDLEFIPDANLQKKISTRYKNYKSKVQKEKKRMIMISLFIIIPLVILLVLGILGFLFRENIDRSIKNWQAKIKLEKLKKEKELEEKKNKDLTSDQSDDELIVKKVINTIRTIFK